MGEMISFFGNGQTGSGYLAVPVVGKGPGVVVIQEWWGLVPHIKDVCDRLAAQGLIALAPDLYDGKVTQEPDEADKAMMSLRLDEAGSQLSGAVDEVVRRSGGQTCGVVGFCMGGGLSYVVASLRPDKVSALVPFYGLLPWSDANPDYSRISAHIQGHYAELDESASPEMVRELELKLAGLGKQTEFYLYPGTGHAFFNDTRPEVYDPDASAQAWDRMIPFLEENIY